MTETKTRIDAVEELRRMYKETPEDLVYRAIYRQLSEIGCDVFAAREEAGLTHEQLATKLGVDADTIDSIENADFQGDAIDYLTLISLITGRRVKVSLGDPVPAEPEKSAV